MTIVLTLLSVESPPVNACKSCWKYENFCHLCHDNDHDQNHPQETANVWWVTVSARLAMKELTARKVRISHPCKVSACLLICLCFDFYVIRVCCVLVWRGTPSKFGHFLILSTNHSHTSSKLSKSSQNWSDTKIFFKYPTHNWCRNIPKMFRFLEQHEKSISSTAQS